jgi:hypothetical protein
MLKSSIGRNSRSNPPSPQLLRFPSIHWPPALLVVFLCVTRLPAAFEAADLFQGVGTGADPICPPSLNNPALLPGDRLWVTTGAGRPLGLSWAAFTTASCGMARGIWRGSLGAWSSGDELYRETILSIAGARTIRDRLTLGGSLVYNQVSIGDLEPIPGELLAGLGAAGDLTKSIRFALWYGRQPLNRDKVYTSLGRQIFQLALFSQPPEGPAWVLALEKIPAYELSQLVALSLPILGRLHLQAGYRTVPGMPYVGTSIRLSRFTVHFRCNHHPVLGLSPALGLSSP